MSSLSTSGGQWKQTPARMWEPSEWGIRLELEPWNLPFCKLLPATFPPNPRHVIRQRKPHLRKFAQKENAMFIIVKWIAVAIITGFAWLVVGYTIEYFRPYKKVGPRFRKK